MVTTYSGHYEDETLDRMDLLHIHRTGRRNDPFHRIPTSYRSQLDLLNHRRAVLSTERPARSVGG